jgi:hypothetical protein
MLERTLPGVKISKRTIELSGMKPLANRINFLFSGIETDNRDKLMDSLRLPRTLKKEVRSFDAPKDSKPLLSGNDLIELGYRPGPLFKNILRAISTRSFATRKQAEAFVIDKFPKKI